MSGLSLAQKFLDFSNHSPTPFHCVSTAAGLLEKANFERKNLRSDFKKFKELKPNDKVFFTRNESSLVAFAVGGKYKAGNGITAMVAHTDSPALILKPVSRRESEGYLTLGLESYGGGHFDSWFDRDLSVAGRVIIRNKANFETRLVKIDRPILSIPRLAIHLTSSDERSKGFKPNIEKVVRAVIGMKSKAPESHPLGETLDKSEKTSKKEKEKSSHHSELLEEVASELKVSVQDICSFKLFLYDTQPSAIGGLKNEFIYSPRLDNQMMSFVVLSSLIESLSASEVPLSEERNIRMIALFDNEEVGSMSNRGANSRFLLSCIKEILGQENLEQGLERSFLISADMAHAVHPNYAEKHEDNHKNLIGKGLVVKNDSKERYATTDLSNFFVSEIARENNIEIQQSCGRQDSRSGSTVGPFLSSNLGIRTVDVGIPQLAMHSIREMCGVKDVESSVKLLTRFFEQFPLIDEKTKFD